MSILSLTDYKLSILKKIQENPNKVPVLSKELTEDGEFILEATKLSANVWSQASAKLKLNKPFMLLAIEQESSAFIYGASEELRDDDDVALAACKKDSALFFYVSDRLKTESFKDKATKSNSWYPLIKFNKVIKNNLAEGVLDTFALMYGNYGITTKLDGGELSSNRLKYGLVDITLIPQLSNALINYGLPNKLSTSNPFRYLRDDSRWDDNPGLRRAAYLIGMGLQVLRFGMAFLATLVVFPLVAVVHALKFPYAYYQQTRIFALQGEICRVSDKKPVSGLTTLGDFVEQTDSNLNDLCAANFYQAQENDLTTTSSENTEIFRYGSLSSSEALLFFRPVKNNTSSQKKALELVSQLDVNEDYDFNDFEDISIGRSFN